MTLCRHLIRKERLSCFHILFQSGVELVASRFFGIYRLFLHPDSSYLDNISVDWVGEVDPASQGYAAS
jgi:hypothetical protein